MEIFSNGYEKQVWDGCFKGSFNFLNKKIQESVTDKKIKAHYYIRSRYKNNSKRSSFDNNESLYLEFDPNLSPDFVYEEVDFKTGRSITIALEKSHQKSFGDTQLELTVQFIDEHQQLFLNQTFHYCPTLPGTITKRLQAYKVAFDKAVAKELSNIAQKGYQVKDRHIINNFAGYLYFENKRRDKQNKFLSDISPKSDINKILTIYSVLNDDAFWKEIPTWDSSLHSNPYTDRGEFNELQPTRLPAVQVDDLEVAINIFKKIPYRTFENSHDQNDAYKFNYSSFKEKLLNLLKNN